jgi:hypothetical protein
MNNIKERIKIFSGAQLKYIAFLSMLIDHTNKALIYPNLDCKLCLNGMPVPLLRNCYSIFNGTKYR